MLVPDPVVTTTPGILVNTQVSVGGKPLKITLPVADSQVGCVMVPIIGGERIASTANV